MVSEEEQNHDHVPDATVFPDTHHTRQPFLQHTHTHTHTHTYINTYIHTEKHKYTNTQTQTKALSYTHKQILS